METLDDSPSFVTDSIEPGASKNIGESASRGNTPQTAVTTIADRAGLIGHCDGFNALVTHSVYLS